MAFSDIIGVLSLKRDVIKRLSETEGAGKEGSLIVFLTGLIASVLGGLIAGNIGSSIITGLFGGLVHDPHSRHRGRNPPSRSTVV